MVIASRIADKKHRIYHKTGCIHGRRIKKSNRIQLTMKQAEKHGYRACKCCEGLKGDVRILKRKYKTRQDVNFTYLKPENELYAATPIGFWKICVQRRTGDYLLYHRNFYKTGMSVKSAIRGEYHRQADVCGTKSLESLIEYIIAHDRAKVTIMDDYRKLPQRTRKQKHYYRVAERRNRRRAMHRVDRLFAMLEQTDAGMKQYSIC